MGEITSFIVSLVLFLICLIIIIFPLALLRNIYRTVHRIEDSTYSELKKENEKLKKENA